MKKPLYTVLICTKNLLYGKTLAKAISTCSNNFEIISTVNNFEKASKLIQIKKVDYLLLRMDKTLKTPFNFIQFYSKKFPKTKLIILTFLDHANYNKQLIQSGAEDFYLIDQKIDVLVEKMLHASATKLN